MASDRQIQEIVARYVAIMGFYYNDGKTIQTKAAMVAEVRAITASVSAAKLDRRVIHQKILRPVKGKLIARYSLGDGTELNGEFVKIFKGSIVG